MGPSIETAGPDVIRIRVSIRETLSLLGIRPSKGLGQNFLVNPETARRIADSAAVPFSTAVEIGSGLGALTEMLLAAGAAVPSIHGLPRHFPRQWGSAVHAVEIDRRLCEFVRERFSSNPNLNLIEGDAVAIDWNLWLAGTRSPRVLFGNLPYSVSASLIEKLFQNAHLFSEAVLCFQSEVAARLLSAGGRGMSPITLLAHRFCARREKVFRLPPGAFYPRPQVSSTLVRLSLRPGVTWTPADARVPRILFSQRRKKLSSYLEPAILSDFGRFLGKSCASKRIDELTIDEASALAELARGPGFTQKKA